MKRIVFLLSLVAGLSAFAQDTSARQMPGQQEEVQAPEVPFVPTPQDDVDQMLELAGVKPGDVVYDLGSGDGRIVITAVQKYGARGVGVDINPVRISEANENARRAGVEDQVEFRQGDLFKADIGDASVVTLYLLPSVNERLKPKLLAELKPGTRIVSHDFDMGDWKPVKQIETNGSTLYLWVVPERGGHRAPR
ncbi:methyltransferase domain-containing protein [Archangium violaceum]|uniref:SAM-dependent methyltransferase n=1 Tax=Archangium violaceum TaxID=83451 RepID=UPI00193B55DD|nr:methyltransferase domain-containing protein [Archangium violaceum]QRK06174.1 methyltransferase domain-containing protein [Archangium violaceum]